MQSDWVRFGLIVLFCSNVAFAQTPPVAPAVKGGQDTAPDAAATKLAQKKKSPKYQIAQETCAASATRTTMRGIDADGNPYVETVDPDGTRRHRIRGRITVTSPTGHKSVLAQANAPAPTPPLLPATNEAGRAWFERHNLALLDLISQTVNGDATALKNFSAREMQSTNGDTIKQIYFRTDALQFLAGAQ